MVCAFYHTSMKFYTKVHLDVLFHIGVKGKLSFFQYGHQIQDGRHQPFERYFFFINSRMNKELIIKYRTKLNDWDQKASLKVAAMAFNTVYN